MTGIFDWIAAPPHGAPATRLSRWTSLNKAANKEALKSAATEKFAQRHRYTAEEFRGMAKAGIFGEDDRVELIEGEVIDMVPFRSRHAGKVVRLRQLLQRALGDSCLIFTQNPVSLGDRTQPQPDVAVRRRRADYYAGLPSLLSWRTQAPGASRHRRTGAGQCQGSA